MTCMRKKAIIRSTESAAGRLIHLRSGGMGNEGGDFMISKLIEFGNKVRFGANASVDDYVVMGKNVAVGSNTTIHTGAMIGSNVRIDDGASICKPPMNAVRVPAGKKAASREQTINCHIGDAVMVGSGAVVYQGAVIGKNCRVGDYAVIQENAVIGDNTVIEHGAVIEGGCKIGNGCAVGAFAAVGAGSVLEDGCRVGTRAVALREAFDSSCQTDSPRGVSLKKGACLGAGAVMMPGTVIFEGGQAAPGSVVTSDIPAGRTAAGNPAVLLPDIAAKG